MAAANIETCCSFRVFFFFQAEDGIRDVAVTGVQTCALPIYQCRQNPCLIGSSGSISFADKARILTALIGSIATNFTIFSAISTMAIAGLFRSEERRVGKECRSR